MSTSLIDDTSPESVIGKKGKSSPKMFDQQEVMFVFIFSSN